MNIFSATCYRRILKALVDERKQVDSKINFQQAASYARMPKSYLSKVVNGKADLHSDQLYLICEFFELNQKEQAYMALLLEHARTAIAKRKAVLAQQIKLVREQNFQSKEYILPATVELGEESLAAYYLDPLNQIIHICLSIPRYQRDLSLLAADLNQSPARILSAANKLEQMGMIERSKAGIKPLKRYIHLPKASVVYKPWRNQLKLLTANRLDRLADDQSYSVAAVFSATEAARRKVLEILQAAIKDIEGTVVKAEQEEVYQLNVDLLSWTLPRP